MHEVELLECHLAAKNRNIQKIYSVMDLTKTTKIIKIKDIGVKMDIPVLGKSRKEAERSKHQAVLK